MAEVREVLGYNEFFDIISGMPGGRFVNFAYISNAKLVIGKKNYFSIGRLWGYTKDDIVGVVKLTRYKINYTTPDSIGRKYGDYKEGLDKIRAEYGLKPSQTRDSYTQRINYGKNGVKVYQGNNIEKTDNAYMEQNVRNAVEKESSYYLVAEDGSVVMEIGFDKFKDLLGRPPQDSGVAELKERGESQEVINAYKKAIYDLGLDYRKFESKSILYLVGGGEVGGVEKKFFYKNTKFQRTINGVTINPESFLKIADDKLKKDLNTINESIRQEKIDKIINETINRLKKFF